VSLVSLLPSPGGRRFAARFSARRPALDDAPPPW